MVKHKLPKLNWHNKIVRYTAGVVGIAILTSLYLGLRSKEKPIIQRLPYEQAKTPTTTSLTRFYVPLNSKNSASAHSTSKQSTHTPSTALSSINIDSLISIKLDSLFSMKPDSLTCHDYLETLCEKYTHKKTATSHVVLKDTTAKTHKKPKISLHTQQDTLVKKHYKHIKKHYVHVKKHSKPVAQKIDSVKIYVPVKTFVPIISNREYHIDDSSFIKKYIPQQPTTSPHKECTKNKKRLNQ